MSNLALTAPPIPRLSGSEAHLQRRLLEQCRLGRSPTLASGSRRAGGRKGAVNPRSVKQIHEKPQMTRGKLD